MGERREEGEVLLLPLVVDCIERCYKFLHYRMFDLEVIYGPYVQTTIHKNILSGNPELMTNSQR